MHSAHWIFLPWGVSLGAQKVENLPAIQGPQVQSLGPEDPLEKEMATHSSILAWRIPRTEEPGGLQSMRLQRVRHDWDSPIRFTKSYQKQIQILPGEKPPLYKLPGYPGLKSTNVSLQSKINKFGGKITLKEADRSNLKSLSSQLLVSLRLLERNLSLFW